MTLPRAPWLSAAVCVLLLVGAAGAIVGFEKWNGPILLSLSSDHGVHTGDLPSFPLVLLAIGVWRDRVRRHSYSEHGRGSRNVVGPASAVVLGVLLLLAGVSRRAEGGPLVPVGGGTIDGTISQAGATDAVPIDHWSDVAVTYDGATARLYVNGRRVASRGTAGPIQITPYPLWIGGNMPFGEHFHGLIDEVRVYARALREDEIRNDMAKPVAPARALVAAYAFDAGFGTTAVDSSGEGNAGTIRGATWTEGRYGDALSFDGSSAVVRVPASSSLNLTHAMTLSGWVRPTAPQTGWRTIVQRQTGAYFLTASSDRYENGSGWFDDLRTAVLVAALVSFCVPIATRQAGWAADPSRSWWHPVGLFMVGSLGDALVAPTGSLIGPSLVALWLAAIASNRVEALAFVLAAVAFALVTIASLAGLAGVLDVALSRDDGAIARTAALGALFVLAGAAQLAPSTRP